jgi:hypothetical protein
MIIDVKYSNKKCGRVSLCMPESHMDCWHDEKPAADHLSYSMASQVTYRFSQATEMEVMD